MHMAWLAGFGNALAALSNGAEKAPLLLEGTLPQFQFQAVSNIAIMCAADCGCGAEPREPQLTRHLVINFPIRLPVSNRANNRQS